MEAIKANRYHEAMVGFTKVVENEKYEISGKDLSQAYAYLAMMRTLYLEKDMAVVSFNNVINKQGHIQLTIHDMVRAIQFQDSNTKPIVDNSKKKLIEISVRALQVIGDSLMTFDENDSNETIHFLSSFAIQQFGELENIAVQNWQIHDILGLAHFFLGEKEKSMLEFQKGRDEFFKLGDRPVSHLHLRNYILSANYYLEQNNKKEGQKVCKGGSAYATILINNLGDDQMNEILRLNKIENKFRTQHNLLK